MSEHSPTTYDVSPSALISLAAEMDVYFGGESTLANKVVETLRVLARGDHYAPSPAPTDVAKLREALTTVLASLVAVTSILSRAEADGVKPSQTVGSNKIFRQMLRDYEAAVEIGRAALLSPQAPGATEGGETGLRKALEDERYWHETQDKVLSKSGRRDADCLWFRNEHRMRIEAIDAALSSVAPREEGWRSIKSAPKMEAVLVAGGDAHYPVVGSWSGEAEELWRIDGQSDVHDEIGWPTHWMPLPADPAALSSVAPREEGWRPIEPVTLEDCPIGLFWCGDELCLKTEYGDNEGRIDAYIVSSGEFFWGGTGGIRAKQRKVLVRPVPDDALPTAPRIEEKPDA